MRISIGCIFAPWSGPNLPIDREYAIAVGNKLVIEQLLPRQRLTEPERDFRVFSDKGMMALTTPLRTMRNIVICGALWSAVTPWLSSPAFAQELEPRRWSHLPSGQNFANLTYAHTEGDIAFDPVLGIADADMALDTVVIGYVRSFELLHKSARIEIRQAWQDGRWDGLVNGIPTSVERAGLADTFVRVAVNLVGGPPLSGKAYGAYRAANDVETIVGAAVVVQVPTGEYLDDKLINLGNNRFTIRPQLGLQHRRRNWTFEATAMAWIFTDNGSFFNGNRLVQDPLLTLDGTVIYTFKSGIWASGSAGIGFGGQTAVNGVANDDRKEDFAWAVSVGFPITRSLGFRVNYINSDRWKFVGNESQTISIGLSASWQ